VGSRTTTRCRRSRVALRSSPSAEIHCRGAVMAPWSLAAPGTTLARANPPMTSRTAARERAGLVSVSARPPRRTHAGYRAVVRRASSHPLAHLIRHAGSRHGGAVCSRALRQLVRVAIVERQLGWRCRRRRSGAHSYGQGRDPELGCSSTRSTAPALRAADPRPRTRTTTSGRSAAHLRRSPARARTPGRPLGHGLGLMARLRTAR